MWHFRPGFNYKLFLQMLCDKVLVSSAFDMHFKKYIKLNPPMRSPWESLDPKSFPHLKTPLKVFSEECNYANCNEAKCPNETETTDLALLENLSKFRLILPKVTPHIANMNDGNLEKNKKLSHKYSFAKQYENCKDMMTKNPFKRPTGTPISKHNTTKRKSRGPVPPAKNLVNEDCTVDLTGPDETLGEDISKNCGYLRSLYKLPACTTIVPVAKSYVRANPKLIEPSIEIKRASDVQVTASPNLGLCDLLKATVDKTQRKTKSAEPHTIIKRLNLTERVCEWSPSYYSGADQDPTIASQIADAPHYNFDINEDGDVIPYDHRPLVHPNDRESPGCSEGTARNKVGVKLMKAENGYKVALL